MNKRGINTALELWAAIIIIAAFILLMLINQARIAKAMTEAERTQYCKTTILANSAKTKLGAPSATEIIQPGPSIKDACPTKYVTFFEGHLEKEWDDNTPKDRPVSQNYINIQKCLQESKDNRDYCNLFENINKNVAKEIADCWGMSGEGHLSVFSRYTEETQCLICSEIFFDSKLQEKYGGDFVSYKFVDHPEFVLDNYLRATPSGIKDPNNIGNAQISLYEYSLDFIDKYGTSPYYDFDMNKEYAIVLVAHNKDVKKILINAIIDRYTGSSVPEEVEGNFLNTLEFIETEKIPETCGYIK